MMSMPCLYTIVRFCPFIETEEFANVGIIMIAPERNQLTYKLMTKRHARVTNFFEIEGALFKTAIQGLKEELDRLKELLKVRALSTNDQISTARALFAELVRPRETVIKFGNVRGVLAVDAKAQLDNLYSHYVDREFATKEYRETVLEREMRLWFHEAGVANRFEKAEVGNDEYHATFPFVEYDGGYVAQVVKPLNLAQDQPNKILDHGGQWLFRIQTLKRKRLLPERVLFAVEGPDGVEGKENAYNEIVGALRESGARVIPYVNKREILEFVQASSPETSSLDLDSEV